MSRYKALNRDRRERPGPWGVCHDIIGCIVTGEGLAAGVCRDTPGDMAVTWLRHGAQQRARVRASTRQGTLATRSKGGHDTVPYAPRYSPARAMTRPYVHGLGAMLAQCAPSQGPLGVYLVHPTQFDSIHCSE